MKTIKTAVYETDDGRLWKDKAQAKRHAAWLELVALCIPMADEIRVASHGVGGASDKQLATDLAESLLGNSDKLTKLFRADPCEGGGEPNVETRDACECGRAYIAPDDIVCHLCLEENEQESDEPSPLDLSVGEGD